MACTIHNTTARDAALTILAGRGQVSNELVYAHVKYKLVLNQIRIGRDRGDGVCVWRLGQ